MVWQIAAWLIVLAVMGWLIDETFGALWRRWRR